MGSSPTQKKYKTVILAGNPNVGKSVFFNYLSKLYVDVSNYPGTTVEITSAELNKEIEIKDTPGIYGVSSFNDEERVARDIVLYGDVIVNIVSAISLERDLFLTCQLIDMGKPIILVINQIDEADSINLKIDFKKLSLLLGILVYKTIAITGEGMEEVKKGIIESKEKIGNIDPVLKNELTELLPLVSNQGEALLLLEGDLAIAERHKIEPRNKRNEIYSSRRKHVNEILEQVIDTSSKKERFLTKISNLLIHPFVGSITAVFIAYIFLYQFLGIWVGGKVIDFTEGKIMNGYYEPFIQKQIARFFPHEIMLNKKNEKQYFFGPHDYIEEKNLSTKLPNNTQTAIGTILAGKYGILTLTVTYLLGLLFPLVVAFYTALAILEDSGYLPRLAVLLDGLLTKLGMNGRAIIPLVLGLGCVTMAAVTTRLLTTKREKIIAMTILGFAIPCSAQLGVIQSLLANNGGISSWLIWLSVLSLVLVFTGVVMNKFLPGKATPLLIDLPPLRLPRIKNVFSKAKNKIWFFMTEAVPAFFFAAFIVAFLQVTGFLEKIILFCEPIFNKLLFLPKEVSISFILGMVRRDFGAFGLTELPLTSSQVTVASVVLTLFVPCIATVAVMAKEQNWKVAGGIWISSMVLAISIGAVLARIMN